MNKTSKMKNNWICTDPDNEQYGRKVRQGIYEFKEKNRGLAEYEEDEFIELTIHMEHYSDEEIEDYISPYYSGINEVKKLYEDDAEWILAECIFEQLSELY